MNVPFPYSFPEFRCSNGTTGTVGDFHSPNATLDHIYCNHLYCKKISFSYDRAYSMVYRGKYHKILPIS